MILYYAIMQYAYISFYNDSIQSKCIQSVLKIFKIWIPTTIQYGFKIL